MTVSTIKMIVKICEIAQFTRATHGSSLVANMPRQQFGFVDVVLKAAAIEGAPVKALSVIIGHK